MNATVVEASALPVVTAVAGLIGLVLPQRSRRAAAGVGLAGTGLAFVGAVLLAARIGHSTVDSARRIVSFGGLDVSADIRVDATAALVAVAVGAVAFAVQLYSTGYLLGHEPVDKRYAPYAAQVSLFTAAMLLVVVSGDLVVLLVGWEVMGLCSYLLIGHDRSLAEAPGAAVKAFLVTRVGDIGFALGIAVLGVSGGTFRIAGLLEAVTDGRIDRGPLTLGCLLLLAGVAGKSAQFPLHTWLPDAMAGPTPVSALIHAATMVAAGVYVLARLFGLYAAAPTALTVLAVSASITMLLGACAACAQDDIKRVLAWSTVSQIAYMAGGVAVGGVNEGLFHLLTHAAFKALLFLAAGAVIHAVGTTLMEAMGGLRRGAPVTFAAMTIGLAALVGLPPFSGFFSKEGVLGAAHRAADGEGAVHAWVGWMVLAAGVVTALLTGAYATRLWLRVFFGARRGGSAADPPWSMRAPLLALSVPAALLGIVALVAPRGAPSVVRLDGTDVGTMTATLGATALGIAVVGLSWLRDPATDPVVLQGPLRRAFASGFGVDRAQDVVIVRPVRALARWVSTVDTRVVDGAVEGTGSGAWWLGGVAAMVQARGLGRHLVTVLGGAVVLGIAAVVLTGVLS